MPDVVKCPACANNMKQKFIGNLLRPSAGEGVPMPSLYKCGACGYLHVVPPLAPISGQS